MTPEEKAVIEAAEAWFTGCIYKNCDVPPQLRAALDVLSKTMVALRASREPKPRYFVQRYDREKREFEWAVYFQATDPKTSPMFVSRSWSEQDCEKIARLLNEADK